MKEYNTPGGYDDDGMVIPHPPPPPAYRTPSPPRTSSDSSWEGPLAPRLSPLGCSDDSSAPAHDQTSDSQTDNLVEEIYVDKPSITKVDRWEEEVLPPPDESLYSDLEEPGPKTRYDVVVGLHLGSTNSGYAFAYTDPSRDSQIHLMTNPQGEERWGVQQKCRSVVLLDRELRLHSFGPPATEFYHELAPHHALHWLYLDNFNIYTDNGECEVEAVDGRRVSAKVVWREVLAHLRSAALHEVGDARVRWVLAVPPSWSDHASLRITAYSAGVGSAAAPDDLLMVEEAEAATVSCRNLHFDQIINSSKAISQGKYMVVDCGGNSSRVTVHSVAATSLSAPSSSFCGATIASQGVDWEFRSLMDRVLGAGFMARFGRDRPAGHQELTSAFEARKRAASPHRTAPYNIFPPFSLVDYFKKTSGKEIDKAVLKCGSGELSWSNEGILKIQPSLMNKLFQPTVDKIIELIEEVLDSRKSEEVGHLFLVGGFSESPILQDAIRKRFSDILQIVIPQNGGLCVLKGAVLHGIDPVAASSRKVTHSYGIGVVKPFIQGTHPQEKLVVRGGRRWCVDLLERLVDSGQSVSLGQVTSRVYTPALAASQTDVVLHIYSTLSRTTQFITDPNVKRCGTLRLKLPPAERQGGPREITVSLLFGLSDVTAFAVDTITGASVQSVISDAC